MNRSAFFALLSSMTIFGTIGLFRRMIPLSSGLIVLVRSIIGVLFLLAVVLLKKETIQKDIIRRNLLKLVFSGIFLALNWVCLFEAIQLTSVSIATLAYNLAPMIVILVSPLFFRERLTPLTFSCAMVAFLGMAMVSGVFEESLDSFLVSVPGLLIALASAFMYAALVCLNKATAEVPSNQKSIIQLAISALTIIPYMLIKGDPFFPEASISSFVLLGVVGIVHTGLAYLLYFYSINHLKVQTVAFFSYLDPILAVLLAALILDEKYDLIQYIGMVLIIGAALLAVWSSNRKKPCEKA